jgi:hypothetical protein
VLTSASSKAVRCSHQKESSARPRTLKGLWMTLFGKFMSISVAWAGPRDGQDNEDSSGTAPPLLPVEARLVTQTTEVLTASAEPFPSAAQTLVIDVASVRLLTWQVSLSFASSKEEVRW